MKKFLSIVAIIALVAVLGVTFAACNKGTGTETASYRFTAPEGTPALAITKLVTDNKTIDGAEMTYEVVSASNIAAEMTSQKSDLVIMPVNAGAKLITAGADYKLVSVAVYGSLYLVGKADTATTVQISDLGGKTIACIGQTGTPGLVFRYVMKGNNLEIISDGTPTSSQVLVKYVADGTAAKTLIAGNSVDYAVVGEPAATAFKGALGCLAQMDMQAEYAKISGTSTYPQAGLFVRTSIAANSAFMTELFSALAASKTWVTENAADVTAFAQTNLYESAAFPAASIPRCNIDATALTTEKQAQIITFLKAVMPKDSNGNPIDWDSANIF